MSYRCYAHNWVGDEGCPSCIKASVGVALGASPGFAEACDKNLLPEVLESHTRAVAEVHALRAERDALSAEALEWSKSLGFVRGERDRYRAALEQARDELGVPQPGCPAPVANAANIIKAALEGKE